MTVDVEPGTKLKELLQIFQTHLNCSFPLKLMQYDNEINEYINVFDEDELELNGEAKFQVEKVPICSL